jgi:hypothetical protein
VVRSAFLFFQVYIAANHCPSPLKENDPAAKARRREEKKVNPLPICKRLTNILATYLCR